MEKKLRFKIDKSKLSEQNKAMPQYMKLLNKTLRLGDGSVVVMGENHTHAMVAADPINAMLGTVEVPIEALVPLKEGG